MTLPFYNWSRTAASNATADATVNWSEGQSPSSVNDSARAMMASTAAFRDDISGAIVTAGTSTAYTVTSYQIFDTLAHMANQMIAFTPHVTNGATVTLNVDGLGAKPLRPSPSVELLAGILILGTPYVAIYNSSDAVFYLHGFYGNPYNMPLAGGMDFWGTTVPNSSFAFPAGQAISRTTYATLFAIMSTTYGAGDGSTTFNLPDKTGRVSAMKESVATRLTSTYFVGNSTTMGATGGAESQTLTLAQLPTGITGTGSATHAGGQVPAASNNQSSVSSVNLAGGGTSNVPIIGGGGGWTYAPSMAATFTSNNTSGNAHTIVQPTIVCNYIIRVI